MEPKRRRAPRAVLNHTFACSLCSVFSQTEAVLVASVDKLASLRHISVPHIRHQRSRRQTGVYSLTPAVARGSALRPAHFLAYSEMQRLVYQRDSQELARLAISERDFTMDDISMPTPTMVGTLVQASNRVPLYTSHCISEEARTCPKSNNLLVGRKHLSLHGRRLHYCRNMR